MIFRKKDITEHNIEIIELDQGNHKPAKVVEPKDGTAKWFRDELGQIWVKFVPWNGPQQVWPAHRVVRVTYLTGGAGLVLSAPSDPGKRTT